jgi:hypothetical protein
MENEQFNNSPYSVPLQVNSSHRSMKVSDLSSSGPRTARSQLPADFKPSVFSVICGRGKDSYDHAGNHHFRELASMYVARYARAASKVDKSEIVSEMVGMIHKAEGTFCKFEQGAWYKVGDHYAREKAGALLRDLVQAQQRSPAIKEAKAAKIMARKLKKTKAKPTRPRTQKQPQHNGQKLVDVGAAGQQSDNFTLIQAQYGRQQLVDDSAGYFDYSTPTQQCSTEQLVEDSTACCGQSGDDSSMSTWASCWGEEILGLDDDDFVDSFRIDSLEHEDGYFDIFDMDSLL